MLIPRLQPAGSLVGAGVDATGLRELAPNRWHLYSQPLRADWCRQAHAGIAYDPMGRGGRSFRMHGNGGVGACP